LHNAVGAGLTSSIFTLDVREAESRRSAGDAVAISRLRRDPECHPSMPRLADRNGRSSTLKCDTTARHRPEVARYQTHLSDCSCQLLPSTTLLARLQQGRCYRGPIYVGFDFPIGLPMAYAERTALRWPKIPLVSASLKCKVRTADTSSMPKSFAAATCPWLSLQGNDRDDSHLFGVLR
jgi:hypothetical protein